MSNKNKSEFIKNNSNNKDIMEVLLVPVSIVLAGVLIAVSVLYAGSVLLQKDEILTKSNVKTVLTDVLKDSNITTGTATGTAVTATPATVVTADQVKQLYSGNNIVFGDANRKITFVEFSDPSCPYCHVAAGRNGALNKVMEAQTGFKATLVADGGTYVAPVVEMKKLVDEGKASFVWIYDNGHGAGEVATQGLYCAYEKGKFWDVHDAYMTNEGYNLINNTIKNDVTQAGALADFTKNVIDPSFMKSCIESKKYAGRIASDQAVARSFGSSGTPGFIVNTTVYEGAVNYTTMKSTVDNILNS